MTDRLQEIEAREKAAACQLVSYTEGERYGSGDLFFQESRRHKLHFVTLPSELTTFFGHCLEDIPYLLAQLRKAREKLEAVERACKERRFPVGIAPQAGWFVQDVLTILHPQEGGE